MSESKVSRDYFGTAKKDDLLSTDLQATGITVAPGTYPATLFDYSDPFWMPVSEKFRKPNGPSRRQMFDLFFGIAVPTKSGPQMVKVSALVNVPDGGAANKKSNLYKTLIAMRGNDPEYFDNEGNFRPGVNLKKFLGSGASVQVKNNDKGFAQVEAISAPMVGVPCPTMEQCLTLQKAEAAAAADDAGDVPF